MPPLTQQSSLSQRVIRAAEAALAAHSCVSAIDVLCGMGLLASVHVESWRQGRVGFLEQRIQGSPRKILSSLAAFRRWAEEKGLKPSESRYTRSTRDGVVQLQFCVGESSEIEKVFRTHYVSPALSARKQQHLQEKLCS